MANSGPRELHIDKLLSQMAIGYFAEAGIAAQIAPTVTVDKQTAVLMESGRPADNIYAAGEIMAGNILPKGYIGGLGLVIGNIIGRTAGREAANSAKNEGPLQQNTA